MKDFPDYILETMRDHERRKFGFDTMPAEKIFNVAHKFLDLFPVERMERAVLDLAASGRESDRLKSEQIAILLFARHEMDARLRSRTPEQMLAIMKEFTAESAAKG